MICNLFVLQLRVSRDYGKTWVIAETSVVNADWLVCVCVCVCV